MLGLIPLPVKIIAIVFIVLGAAGFGYMKGSAQAEIELANYQAKSEKQISQLKTENAKISDNVTTEYVDRTNTIREKEIIYREAAAKLEPKYDMTTGWVHLHDTAALLADPDAILASDKSPSGVMDNSALAVVISNYRQCHETKGQLVALQKWINDSKAAVEVSNAATVKDKN
jgi:hypothetical protein